MLPWAKVSVRSMPSHVIPCPPDSSHELTWYLSPWFTQAWKLPWISHGLGSDTNRWIRAGKIPSTRTA